MGRVRTDAEAWRLILARASKSELARHLGVTRQLTSRWNAVPPRYADKVAKILGVPISEITPELHAAISALIGRDATPVLPQLIRLLEKSEPGPPKKRK